MMDKKLTQEIVSQSTSVAKIEKPILIMAPYEKEDNPVSARHSDTKWWLFIVMNHMVESQEIVGCTPIPTWASYGKSLYKPCI